VFAGGTGDIVSIQAIDQLPGDERNDNEYLPSPDAVVPRVE
jgi:hypothetical protein